MGNTFSKLYRRHYELISKFNVKLKMLLREGLSKPELYGDLGHKVKIESNDFFFFLFSLEKALYFTKV